MAQTYEFYCERADEAAALAEAAVLDNVRERELRSEKTWRGLAEQARKTAVQRAKAEQVRADKRAAEADEAAEAEEIEHSES
ncbi:hypothetical protein [Erythrobacter sanguineus]|jgi:hypothetical protein|uniref:Uncharacterized protein n=1 Tax=Erythrobacter sanguineus TaxID=198312 RepID=A0A1M7SMG4_9SPHN|nr:hypothetical protein [Erythrobacter sanguineus]MCR9179383.1 hypothetical protein [Erythrobacteraceae bacterium]SHN59660.1 hypothetical protein SAMN02745193_02000 [Erythrobacter sanguineus]